MNPTLFAANTMCQRSMLTHTAAVTAKIVAEIMVIKKTLIRHVTLYHITFSQNIRESAGGVGEGSKYYRCATRQGKSLEPLILIKKMV